MYALLPLLLAAPCCLFELMDLQRAVCSAIGKSLWSHYDFKWRHAGNQPIFLCIFLSEKHLFCNNKPKKTVPHWRFSSQQLTICSNDAGKNFLPLLFFQSTTSHLQQPPCKNIPFITLLQSARSPKENFPWPFPGQQVFI